MKIRLRPDGTWENVYEDDLVQQEIKVLREIQEDLLEMAVNVSDFKESKQIIKHIMELK
jgi:hypothetical protein